MAAASPSIDHLELTWRSIEQLCDGLSEADWKRPTGCPGWSVQDNLAHLIDFEAGALGRPRPDHVPADLSHVKNALGENNEVGVDYRRARSGAAVLDEFRDVAAARVAQLHELTAEDLEQETPTPAGMGTVADMLTMRVMDSWSHEQDIRRALGRPGHDDGPAVAEAVVYLAKFLPLIVGKRAAAPEGSTVVIDIGDLHRSPIRVVDGRARVVDDDLDSPTVSISLSPTTFAALVGGRSDAPDDVVIKGDAQLGQAIVDHLGFLP